MDSKLCIDFRRLSNATEIPIPNLAITQIQTLDRTWKKFHALPSILEIYSTESRYTENDNVIMTTLDLSFLACLIYVL